MTPLHRQLYHNVVVRPVKLTRLFQILCLKLNYSSPIYAYLIQNICTCTNTFPTRLTRKHNLYDVPNSFHVPSYRFFSTSRHGRSPCDDFGPPRTVRSNKRKCQTSQVVRTERKRLSGTHGCYKRR